MTAAGELQDYEDPKRPRAERIKLLGYDYVAQPKDEVTVCNLCGGGRFTVLTHRDRYGFPAGSSACIRCALTVLTPRMNAAAYGRFYDGVYRPLVSAFHGRRIDARTIQPEQAAYAEAMARFVAPQFSARAGAELLDVGGSTGIVASRLSQRFSLKGTVIDPSAAELARARELGLETIPGFIEDWKPGDRRFDVVTLFQTVDHLLDAAETLRKIRSLLRDGGMFVMDIIDFRAVYLRNWSVEGAVKIDHPYYFTEPTTESLLERTGFRFVRRSYSGDHVTYLCRLGPIGERLPTTAQVSEFFREVRLVQNAPSPVADS